MQPTIDAYSVGRSGPMLAECARGFLVHKGTQWRTRKDGTKALVQHRPKVRYECADRDETRLRRRQVRALSDAMTAALEGRAPKPFREPVPAKTYKPNGTRERNRRRFGRRWPEIATFFALPQ